MAFIPFKKSNKCLVTDELFLEITWEEGKSPDDDSELLGIIEGLDQHHFETFHHSIEESLPYVTFLQAELLFQALKDAYGQFQLKKIAIAHLEGREVVTEGEVFASPFFINKDYQNLLLPLIQSILTASEFQSYTYQEKREYFINQIYPVYRSSLGLQESALPLFPEEGESINLPGSSQTVFPQPSKASEPQPQTKVSLKKVYLLLGLLGVLSLGSVLLTFVTLSKVSTHSGQLTYLHQELEKNESLDSIEHQIDVFSRYFLPNYYSGNKELLTDFLSDGDAKYTVPKEGALQSVILEKISYDSDSKEYNVTYVISKNHEGNVSSIRLDFRVKPSTKSKYGFVVTTEPKESDFIKTEN